MAKNEEVLATLKQLTRKHGKVLSLNVIHKTLIRDGILSSQRAVANVLKKLENVRKIRSVSFGVSVEVLENVEEPIVEKTIKHTADYKQSLLYTLGRV